MSSPFNPVLMTGVLPVLGPPPGAQSELYFNPVNLRNPSSQPMLLDEIRFELDVNNPAVPGGAIWAYIRIDGRSLTQNWVPISLLGKMLNWFTEAAGAVAGNPSPCYSWKLPKPLFMRASAQVSIGVRYVDNLFTSPQVVGTVLGPTATLANTRVILVGRTLPEGTPSPAILHVPFAAAWTAPPVVCGGAPVVYNAESTEADLVNTCPEVLHLQRFLGRVMVWDTAANFYDSYWRGWVNGAITISSLEVGSRYLSVKMVRGDGRITVRDETPFHHLFQAIDKSWTVNTLVPTGQFYKVILRAGAAIAGLAASRHVPQISMVGYRDVQVG